MEKNQERMLKAVRVGDAGDGSGVYELHACNGLVIAEYLLEGNARRIVQCVNAYDDLVNAVTAARLHLNDETLPTKDQLLTMLVAALAKATS